MIIFLSFLYLSIFNIFVPRNFKSLYFLLSILIISILAYNFIPSIDLDLFRHFEMFNSLKTGGYSALINSHWFRTQPVFAIYVYILGFFGKSNILPAVSSFIIYGSILFLYNKIISKSKYYLLFGTLFFFYLLSNLSFLAVNSGIRNILAITLFIIILYIDLIKNYKPVIFLYFFVILIHNSVIILVLLRFFSFFFKKIKFFPSLVLILWPFFFDLVIDFLLNLNLIDLFQSILLQAQSYIYGGTNPINSTSLIIMRVLQLFTFFLFILILFRYYPKNQSRFAVYYFYCFLFIISSFSYFDIFIRLSNFLIISFPIFFLSFLIPERLSNFSKFPPFFNIYSTSVIILFISTFSLLFYLWSEYSKIIINI